MPRAESSAKVCTSCGETRREKCAGINSVGWSSPAAPTSSASASSVVRWKLNTRSDLSGTTSARWRTRSWVETPVGLNRCNRANRNAPRLLDSKS